MVHWWFFDRAKIRKLRIGFGTFRTSSLLPFPFSYEPICTPTKSFPFATFLVFENPPLGVIIDGVCQFARLIITDALETVVVFSCTAVPLKLKNVL